MERLGVLEEKDPRRVSRDPIEAEFFHGLEDEVVAFERTDALVREALQNSLDARRAAKKVEVRMALHRDQEALPTEQAEGTRWPNQGQREPSANTSQPPT